MRQAQYPVSSSAEASQICEAFLENLRRKGYRYSESRRTLMRILAATETPLSILKIHQALQREQNCSSISLMTTYRHITLLWREGFLWRVGFEEGAYRYLCTAGTPDKACNKLLVCRKCGDLQHFRVPVNNWTDCIAATGYAIACYRMVFYGLCQECQREVGSW